MIGLLLGGGVLFFAMLLCAKYRDKLFATRAKRKIWLVLGGALILRVILSAAVQGYSIDIGCFTAWSDMAFSQGLPHLYAYAAQNDIFLDYPPGYMFVLYIIGMLRQAFSLSADSPIFWVLLKLPATLFDLGTAYLLWRIAEKKGKETLGLVIAAVYAWHPAFLVTTSLWGQADGVFIFFLLFAFCALTDKRRILSTVFYAVALLIKPQALLFFPVYLWYIAEMFLKKETGALRTTLQCTGVGLAVFAAGVLPFSAGQSPDWIFKLYFGTLSSYRYATLNMFNIYALFGGNFAALEEHFLGISYETWGVVLMALTVLAGAAVYRKRGILTTAAFYNITLCLLGTKMHERYMLAGLALLLAAYLTENRAELRHFFALFGFTAFLNIAYVLFLSLRPQPIYHVAANDMLMIFVSALNAAALIALIYYCLGGKRFERNTHK